MISKKRTPSARPSAKKKTKRRRCENDRKLFLPKLKNQRFCSDECRKQYHRYGSSYGPLKSGLHKAIEKKCTEIFKEVSDQSRRIDRLEKQIENILMATAIATSDDLR